MTDTAPCGEPRPGLVPAWSRMNKSRIASRLRAMWSSVCPTHPPLHRQPATPHTSDPHPIYPIHLHPESHLSPALRSDPVHSHSRTSLIPQSSRAAKAAPTLAAECPEVAALRDGEPSSQPALPSAHLGPFQPPHSSPAPPLSAVKRRLSAAKRSLAATARHLAAAARRLAIAEGYPSASARRLAIVAGHESGAARYLAIIPRRLAAIES